MDFASFFKALPDLLPHEVLATIRKMVLPIRGDASALANLVAQLATARSQEKLIAYHHALFHTVASDLFWSLDVLRTTSNEPLIVGAAVDVFANALTWDTVSALNVVGGINELITLIDKSMSHASVKRFFKALSAKHDRPAAATNLVDALLKTGFTFLDTESPTHLDRVAPCMVGTLSLACSSKVLRQLLPRLASLMVEHHWWKLVQRYPHDIQELVLIQVRGEISENDWFEYGILERPSWLAPCIPLLLKTRLADYPDFGRNFFENFLQSYAERLNDSPPADASMDVLGRDSERVEVLDRFARYYLESITDLQKRAIAALGVLNHFKAIRKVDRLYAHVQLLQVFVYLFAKRPDLWELSLQHPVPREEPVIQGLWNCLDNMPWFATWKSEDWFRISRQPRGARFPLLHLGFSVAGIPLTVAPSEEEIDRFPQFAVELLGVLSPAHARVLVGVGIEAKGAEGFFERGLLQETQMAKQIFWAMRNIKDIPITQRNDAQLAILRAVWVGTTRGPAGDLSGDHGTQDAIVDVDANIKMYLKQAHNFPDPESRRRYTKLALSLCIVSQSARRFADTFAAAMKQFAQDEEVAHHLFRQAITGYMLKFLCGPPGLVASKVTVARPGVTVESLTAWVAASSDVVYTLLRYLKARPEGKISSYADMRGIFCKMFQRRCNMIPWLAGSIFANLETAVAVLLQPIVELVLATEKLQVLEYPAELEFSWETCIPGHIGYKHEIKIVASLAPAFLSLIVDLAKRREDLWREGRAKLPPPPANPDDESPIPDYTHSELLPFSIFVGSKRDRCFDIAAPLALRAYCESVLFPPPDMRAVIFAGWLPPSDPRHFQQRMFESALELYIRWSRRDGLEETLLRLLDFYAAGPSDYSVWVMMSEPIQNVLWKFPKLAIRAKVFLPTSTSSFVVQTPFLSVLTAQALQPTFDPLPSRHPDQLSASLDETKSRYSAWSHFLQFRQGYLHPSAHHLPLSLNTRRQLAAFALSTIATRAKLAPKPVAADADLVTFAIYAGRIHCSFAACKRVANAVVRHMLRVSLAALADSEVVAIIDYLLETESAEAQERAFRILRAVRTHRPGLLTVWSRSWLERPDRTYHHRHFVAPPAFLHITSQDVTSGISDLVKFMWERVDLGSERKQAKIRTATVGKEDGAAGQQPTPDDGEPSEDSPLVKIASVKLVAHVVGHALSKGFIPPDRISLLFDLGRIVPHQSIVQFVVKQLLKLAAADATLRPTAASPAFKALRMFAEMASRLGETHGWDEVSWTKLQTDPKLPLPSIDIEHPIATMFLDIPIQSFTRVFALEYAEMIVQPMVLRNIERTRLLRTISEFQGYSRTLEASYELPFDIPRIYQKFGQFLPHPPCADANEPPSGIVDLLQRRATLVLRRHQYRDLISTCRQRLGVDWALTAHGQALSLLARPAITDDSNSIQHALDGLFQALLAGTTSMEARATITTALHQIGDTYLDVENMKACAVSPPDEPSEPFSLFQVLLQNEVVVNLEDSGKVAWSARVRPIIQHFLDTAKRNAQAAGPMRNQNAFYERTITNLELLLLPHPSHYRDGDSDESDESEDEDDGDESDESDESEGDGDESEEDEGDGDESEEDDDNGDDEDEDDNEDGEHGGQYRVTPSPVAKYTHPKYTLYVDRLLKLTERTKASSGPRGYSVVLDFLGRSTCLDSYDAMKVVEVLLGRSDTATNDTLRVTAVEMAVALIQAYARQLHGVSFNRAPAIRERLLGSDDGRLIALAFFATGSEGDLAASNESPED